MNKKHFYLKIRNTSIEITAAVLLSIGIMNICVGIFFPDIVVIFNRWSIILDIILLGILTLILGRIKILIDIEIKSYPEFYCRICKDWLDKRSDFPENFPDKFKICCRCWNVVMYIYDKINKDIDWNWADKFYKKRKKKFDEIFIVKKGV